MKIAIIGSRYYPLEQKESIYKWLLDLCIMHSPTARDKLTIISGGAMGIDRMAREIAKNIGCVCIDYLPNYKEWGRQAPLIRNKCIVESADLILVGHMRIPSGTWHAVNYAKKIGKKVIINE